MLSNHFYRRLSFVTRMVKEFDLLIGTCILYKLITLVECIIGTPVGSVIQTMREEYLLPAPCY